MSKLYSSVGIGAIRLDHRIVQAPLTRLRSDQPGDAPSAMAVTYYSQRASQGGLQIAEATTVSVRGRGYLGAPGIYSDAQIASWRKVTDAIHARGGFIFLQLWHVGRQSHVSMTGGEAPLAPSAISVEDLVFTKEGWIKTSPSRALEIFEIKEIVEQFRQGAIRAKAAGFDGVEIHGANGYLIDQFLQDGSNKRTDIYGGSIENRTRLLLEVTDAVASVWGADRVGVRLGPSGIFGSMSDGDPDALFGYAASRLNRLGLAYLHLIEPRIDGSKLRAEGLPPIAAHRLRGVFKGPIIAAGGFDRDSAEEIVDKGDADLVAFGRHFAANPDLVERLRRDLPLAPYDRSTFYGGDERGYTDYPSYVEPARAALSTIRIHETDDAISLASPSI
jgi:N-ethylmaleimide reductase